jgi:pimeloyl-ACP methyl ester carboxylesterase
MTRHRHRQRPGRRADPRPGLVRRGLGRHRQAAVGHAPRPRRPGRGLRRRAGRRQRRGPVVEPLVEAVDGYIKSAHLKSPAVIGHSMGGFTGLLLARRHPEDVSRLMIVDSLPFFAGAVLAGRHGRGHQAAGRRHARRHDRHGPRDLRQPADHDHAAHGQVARGPEAGVMAWSKASSQSVVGRAMYDLLTTDARATWRRSRRRPRCSIPMTRPWARRPRRSTRPMPTPMRPCRA